MEQSEIKAEPEAEVKQEIEPETQQQPDPLLLAQLIELLTKQQQQLTAATVKGTLQSFVNLCLISNSESPKPAKKRAGGEYPCGFCEKVFSCYSHMKKHEIVHSDERPFKCDFCEKLFRRKYDCSRHMKVVHIQRFMKRKLEPTVEGRGIFSTFLSCSFCYAKVIHWTIFSISKNQEIDSLEL